MKILQSVFVLVVLVGSSAVWADPVKEIEGINRKRSEAAAKNDLDGFMANVADNVVYTSGRGGFRIEGKAAMRAYFAQFWENYPSRQFMGRQPRYRVFNDGTVVVRNTYTDAVFADRKGSLSTAINRQSQTWVKTNGNWLLVDQHVSRMPRTQ